MLQKTNVPRPAWTNFLTVFFAAWIFAQSWMVQAQETAGLQIFLPIDQRSESAADLTAEWEAKLKDKSISDGADRGALIQRLVAYQRDPSPKTGLAILADFGAYAANKDFRLAAIAQDRKLFLSLDALKYELTVKTSQKLNELRARVGRAPIAYSLRVGSSGQRFMMWVDWAASPNRSLDTIPADATFEQNKLFASDDDITNYAHPNDEANDPIVNEEINGDRAIAAFRTVTRDLGFEVDPRKMKTEYLSPTKAYPILRRKEGGYTSRWPDYLEGLIRLEDEKYNGLFTEEQLRQWAIEKGVVMDLRDLSGGSGALLDNPLSTVRVFDGSAASAFGSNELFPNGVQDGTGWMTNQYRQAFVTNKGNLKSVAKYTLRMLDFWEKLGLDPTNDIEGLGEIIPGDMASIKKTLNAFYNPDSIAEYDAAKKLLGGQSQALEKAKAFNLAVLRGGHQFHFKQLVESTATALVDYHAKRAKDFGAAAKPKPPEISDLLAINADLERGLNAMAGAYGNLPDSLLKTLNDDLAELIGEVDDVPDGDQAFEVELRKNLMVGLQLARDSASDLQRQTAGLRSLKSLRAFLDPQVNSFLKKKAGVDFDDYINQVALGQISRKRLHLVKDSPDGWPRIREVREQWTPEDVARDLRLIHADAVRFEWPDAEVARRLSEYFSDDPGLSVQMLTELNRLGNPTNARPVHIEYVDADGKTVRETVQVSSGKDAALNMGMIMFKGAIKFGNEFKRVWGAWGDLDNAKNLAKAIQSSLTTAGQSDEDRAKAYAQALAATISLLDYAEWLNKHASKPGLFDKVGGTIETMASLSNGDYLTPQGQNDLLFSLAKDLTLLASERLNTAFLVYSVGKWGVSTYTETTSKSDVIGLLVQNGDWDIPQDRSRMPRLKGLNIDGGGGARYIENTPGEKVGGGCDIGDGTHALGPSLLKWVVGVRPESYAPGIMLKGGGVSTPRESLLALFHKAGFESSDPVMNATYEGILAIPGTWATDFYLRNWQNGSTWTPQYLRDLGIVVPTAEDAREIDRSSPVLVGARAANDWTQWNTLLDGSKVGVRKNFGFLVSQYWVQRQFIIETNVICPLIQEATRQVLRDEVVKAEGEFVAEYDRLADRVKDIDKKLWPLLAESARPVPDKMRGNSDAWTRFPVAEDFKAKTGTYRDRLVELEAAIAEQAQQPEQDAPRNAWEAVGRLSPLIEARDILRAITDLSYRYEDNFGQVIGVINANVGRVNAETKGEDTPGLDISPVHVRLMSKTSADAPPPPNNNPEPSRPTLGFGARSGPAPSLEALIGLVAGSDALVAAKEWEKTYLTNIDEARQDLGDRLNVFTNWYATYQVEGEAAKIKSWLDAVMSPNVYDFALKHPHWARILRLRMQKTKLDFAGKTLGSAEDAERVAVAKALLIPGAPEAGAVDAGPAIDAELKRLMKLAGGMFITTAQTDSSEKLAVSDILTARLSTAQNAADGGPDASEIDALVHKWQWVMLPRWDSAPHENCRVELADRFWRQSLQEKPVLKQPLLQSGDYYLMATAMTKDHVPLSQMLQPITLKVAPAWMTGVIEAPKELTNQVSVFLEPTGTESLVPRSELLTGLDLADDGRFMAPICVFTESELHVPGVADTDAEDDSAAPLPAYPPISFWAYAGVRQGTLLNPRSLQSTVTYRANAQVLADPPDPEAAHFIIDRPLKLLAPMVIPVTAEAVDASGRAVPAEIDLVVRGETLPGVSSKTMPMEPGEEVYAVARFAMPRGEIVGESPTIRFDPDQHKDGITLKVELPLYNRGNLEIRGVFGNPNDESLAVAGGLAISELGGDREVGGDGSFLMTNLDPVRLGQPIVIEAVLYAQDDTLLLPVLPKIVRPIVAGGKMNLGRIDVRKAPVEIGPVKVLATDWTQKPLPETGTRVTIDGEPMTLIDGIYTGTAKFEKRDQVLAIEVAHDMPDGNPAIEKIDLTRGFGQLVRREVPDQMDARLKIYAISRLDLTGRVIVEAPNGSATPDQITLQFKPPESDLVFEITTGNPEEFTTPLPEAVRLVRLIEVKATGSVNGADYEAIERTSISPRLVGGRGQADFGAIKLTLTSELISVPDLTGLTVAQAEELVGPKITIAPKTAATADEEHLSGTIYEQDKRGDVAEGTIVSVKVYPATEPKPPEPEKPPTQTADGRPAYCSIKGPGNPGWTEAPQENCIAALSFSRRLQNKTMEGFVPPTGRTCYERKTPSECCLPGENCATYVSGWWPPYEPVFADDEKPEDTAERPPECDVRGPANPGWTPAPPSHCVHHTKIQMNMTGQSTEGYKPPLGRQCYRTTTPPECLSDGMDIMADMEGGQWWPPVTTEDREEEDDEEELSWDGSWNGESVLILTVEGSELRLPINNTFSADRGAVHGRAWFPESDFSLPLTGRIDGRYVYLNGKFSQDGLTVRYTYKGKLTGENSAEGRLAFRFIDLQCFGEEIGKAIGAAIGSGISVTASVGAIPIEDDDEPSPIPCPYKTYLIDWKASRQ